MAIRYNADGNVLYGVIRELIVPGNTVRMLASGRQYRYECLTNSKNDISKFEVNHLASLYNIKI